MVVKAQVPSKHFIGIIESHVGIEHEDFFILIHSPLAQRKGVSIGHPVAAGHTTLLPRQLPSGQSLYPVGHSGFAGQDVSFAAQDPSEHFIGRLNGQPLSLSQNFSSLIQKPLLHLKGKLTGHSSSGQSANFFRQLPSLHLVNSEGHSVSSLQFDADFEQSPLGHLTGLISSHLSGERHSPLSARQRPSQQRIGVSSGHDGWAGQSSGFLRQVLSKQR